MAKETAAEAFGPVGFASAKVSDESKYHAVGGSGSGLEADLFHFFGGMGNGEHGRENVGEGYERGRVESIKNLRVDGWGVRARSEGWMSLSKQGLTTVENTTEWIGGTKCFVAWSLKVVCLRAASWSGFIGRIAGLRRACSEIVICR